MSMKYFFKTQKKNLHEVLWFLGIKNFHGLIHELNSSNEFTFF
jgi:hypothetical protein